MSVNIGHSDRAGGQGDPGAGRRAGVREPAHGDRAARAARREARRAHAGRPRRLLLHQRRRGGERERVQDRARRHRAAEDPGALSLVSRRHGRRDRGDRRSAPLVAAADAGLRARARSVSRHPARMGHGGGGAPRSRRDHPARRAAHDRGVHPRDGDRHQRHPRAAGRIPAGRARALRQVRHPHDCRRSDGRLRTHGRLVRHESLERGARHDDDGEGVDELVRAAWGRGDAAEAGRPLQGHSRSRAASPTAAIRSRAPRRWRPSR